MRTLFPLALAAALATSVSAEERALQFLEDRHTHGLLHQVGDPAEGTPPALGRADCTAVRALTRQQKNHARIVGRVFERSGIHLDQILSSRWCRALETAQLLKLRPVTEEPSLNALEDEGQTDAVLDLLDGIRAKETALLVTHGANIKALTGEDTVPGEVVIVRLRPGSDPEIRGRHVIE